ncbi:CU044_5270 family protein [Plantactinospora solaniradicis]|uniref:CU044_5270 family protein n=1 Tax=Plantactinospora solaniradicis TaxID=1723736 RepID=A0ABW1K4Z9_9ACTN
MNPTPIQPDANDRAELARLLPEPVERDLPSDRHQLLQEFVMSHIDQDLRAAEQAPRRAPKRRRVWLTSALTAAAATTAAAVVIGLGGVGGSVDGGSVDDGAAPPVVTEMSGSQILLAAATAAEQAPEGSGTYWYTKTVSRYGKSGTPQQYESWRRRDGQSWFRGEKTKGEMFKIPQPVPFSLGGSEISIDQLQKLPTQPDALKTWLEDTLLDSDVRTSDGKLTPGQQQQLTFEGLISLVSQLPAPPKVRAAAFRAIAMYPNVKSLGKVDGGQGLEITLVGQETPAKLVVDLGKSQIRETSWYVTPDGGNAGFAGDHAADSSYTLTAEWTNNLPK